MSKEIKFTLPDWTQDRVLLLLAAAVVILIWVNYGGNDPGPEPYPPRPIDGDVQEIARDAVYAMAREYAFVSDAVAERADDNDFKGHEELHRFEEESFAKARKNAFQGLGDIQQEAIGQRGENDRIDNRAIARFAKERAQGFRGVQ